MLRYKGYEIAEGGIEYRIISPDGSISDPIESIQEAQSRIDRREVEDALKNGAGDVNRPPSKNWADSHREWADSVVERFMKAQPATPRYRVYKDVVSRFKYKSFGVELGTRITLLHIDELEQEIAKKEYRKGFEDGRKSAFREYYNE